MIDRSAASVTVSTSVARLFAAAGSVIGEDVTEAVFETVAST